MCYLEDMDTSGVAYATAEFGRGGLRKFWSNQAVRASRTTVGPVVSRLSQATRQKIFRELVLGGASAEQEAYEMFPKDPAKRAERFRELYEKHRAAVRRRYNLTPDEQRSIISEGVKKRW